MPETPSETPSEGLFNQDFPQMFQEILDNLKGIMPPKQAESFEAEDRIAKSNSDFWNHPPFHVRFHLGAGDYNAWFQIKNRNGGIPNAKIGIRKSDAKKYEVLYFNPATTRLFIKDGKLHNTLALTKKIHESLNNPLMKDMKTPSAWVETWHRVNTIDEESWWETEKDRIQFSPKFGIHWTINGKIVDDMTFEHIETIGSAFFVGEEQELSFPVKIEPLFAAEDWEDINWESHEPTNDPSPFESIEWEQLPLPPVKIGILMRAFTKSGYSCLIVGGAVRDVLLGLEPKDYDLATDATPDEVKEVVNGLTGYRYVLGPQAEKSLVNLTSLVTIPDETEAVEITTFRKELGYAGDRTKGEFIPAKTFTEDSERRDLTINAMGMTVEGILIDPQNGKEDLQKGVIRAVGNPTQRFVEDPLRMIRAIRFSTKYGMPMEPATYQGIIDNVDLIPTLSPPRLRQEIGKVLVEPNGFQMLMETGILPILMPEFRNMKDYHHKLDYHPEGSLYNHYIEAFKKYTTIENRSELGAWALLFHDIAKPQTAEWNEEHGYHTFYGHDKQGAKLVLDNYNNTVGPFEFSKKELQSIAWTTDNHLGRFWEMTKPMKVSAMRNNENWPMLVEVVTGDTMGIRRGGDEQLAARIEQINEITDKVNEQKAKTGNRPPGFAKQVIQELNVKGQEISIALNQIEEMVSTGQVQSYDEALEVLKTNRNA